MFQIDAYSTFKFTCGLIGWILAYGFRIGNGLRVFMRILRYIGRLIGEFFVFAWQNKAWWIIPIVLVLLMLMALIVTGSSVAPYIYTLF